MTVSALAQVDLAHAQLAYLSACSTADPGSLDLLDESIHLTSAFQLAGFPHVVGTLWPIDDRLAAEIAESFYTRLTPSPPGNPDPAQSAAALHHTIRTVRDRYPATPLPVGGLPSRRRMIYRTRSSAPLRQGHAPWSRSSRVASDAVLAENAIRAGESAGGDTNLRRAAMAEYVEVGDGGKWSPRHDGRL